MGCQSSKDTKAIITRIKQQDQKIDDLININHVLQQKLSDLHQNTVSEGKHSLETNDLTNLIESRFNKLEKTVEKMHHDVKAKLFEGVTDNLDRENEPKMDKSLTLNFATEALPRKSNGKQVDPQWKDLLDESNDFGTRVTIEKLAAARRNYPEQRGSSKSVEKVERIGGGLGSINIVNHNQVQIEMEKDALVN